MENQAIQPGPVGGRLGEAEAYDGLAEMKLGVSFENEWTCPGVKMVANGVDAVFETLLNIGERVQRGRRGYVIIED